MDIALSNLAVRHLVAELQPLINAFVNKAQTLENGFLKLKVHTKAGDKNLVVTPTAFFISNYPLSAKQNPGGFSALLKKYLMNQRIVSLTQHAADRVVLFEFPEVFLVVELFAKGNLVLCDKEMKIIRAMRREEWKDRKLEGGEVYKFPSSKGTDPSEESLVAFEKKLKDSNKTFFGAAVDALNTSPAILEHVFGTLGLDKKADANSAAKADAKRLLEKIKEIYSSKAVKPFVFEGSLYTTELGKPKEQEFADINSALNALLLSGEHRAEPVLVDKAKKKQDKFLREMTAKQAQISGLAVQESELQKKGELVYLHYNEIKELLGAIAKAKQMGLSEKEIVSKINAVKPLVKELDFSKKRLVVKLE